MYPVFFRPVAVSVDHEYRISKGILAAFNFLVSKSSQQSLKLGWEMNKILILFGHPAFKRSTINAALKKAVENLKGVTFHDLYASYPDFLIDVAHEQKLCESHDIIIFQHPFY